MATRVHPSKTMFLLFSLVGTLAGAGAAAAAESKELAAGFQVEGAGKMTNRLRFVTGKDADDVAQGMRDRLADPEQRAKVRAEQRVLIQQQHASVGRVLGIDAETELKLIEVLTDQQMDHLGNMYGGEHRTDSVDMAQDTTERLQAQRDVLGEETFERFLDYQATLSERQQVERFASRLPPDEKLQPEQEDRLIELYREQTERRLESMRIPRLRSPGLMQSMSGLRRQSLLDTIAANEDEWRRREIANRELSARLDFLTARQVEELTKLSRQDQDQLRTWIESARKDEGLDRKIPETVVAEALDARKAVDGQIELDMQVMVNREAPKNVKRTVRNGQPFTFEAADGLTAEAVPILYDDGWLSMIMKYYERSPGGKRLLQGGGAFAVRTRMPDGSPGGGGGGSVLTGRKGYAVQTIIRAKEL